MYGDQPHLRGEQKSEKIVQHGETVYTMTRRWENSPQNIYTILLSNFNWGAKASVKIFFSTCFQHQMTEKSPLQSELDVQTIKLGPSLFFLFLRCNSSALILFMVPQYLQWILKVPVSSSQIYLLPPHTQHRDKKELESSLQNNPAIHFGWVSLGHRKAWYWDRLTDLAQVSCSTPGTSIKLTSPKS